MPDHSNDDQGRADDVHDPSIDRDNFTGIPVAEVTPEHEAEARRLYDEHDPAEWDLKGDDD